MAFTVTSADLFPLLLSLRVAALATALTFVTGIALAWALARKSFPGRNLLSGLVSLPLVLPPTVLGYYLLVLIGRQGPVGSLLYETFGISLVFTWPAAVLAATVAAFPLMARSAQAAFEAVDPDIENAARTLGRSEIQVFLTVTLPLAWQGVLAGTGLAFTRALGEFGATLMVAGNIPQRTQTMSVAIYDAVQTGNMVLANTLVAIMTVVAITALLLLERTVRANRV